MGTATKRPSRLSEDLPLKNLLALLGFGLVLFLGLGYYLNWYSFSSKPAADGHQRYEIDLNAKKIGQDTQRGVQVAGEKINDLLDKDKRK